MRKIEENEITLEVQKYKNSSNQETVLFLSSLKETKYEYKPNQTDLMSEINKNMKEKGCALNFDFKYQIVMEEIKNISKKRDPKSVPKNLNFDSFFCERKPIFNLSYLMKEIQNYHRVDKSIFNQIEEILVNLNNFGLILYLPEKQKIISNPRLIYFFVKAILDRGKLKVETTLEKFSNILEEEEKGNYYSNKINIFLNDLKGEKKKKKKLFLFFYYFLILI